ncbi:MAG: glycosyltransferase family 4 protein [Gaiellaceae bacterium]
MSARTAVRGIVVPPARLAVRGLVRARTARWHDHSHLFALGDRNSWSVAEDAVHLSATARRLGYEVGPARWAPHAERQTIFHASHFEALSPRWLGSSHRLGTAYLHGRPGTPGYPEFDLSYETLRRQPERLDCIQVTHAEMHELVLSAGVDPTRVFRIPIGIDIENVALVDPHQRAEARRAFDLGQSAFVVGSFQKDGVGWGEGLEPKLVKGPDVLVAALETVHAQAPELVVFLTGPARGYVRSELNRLDIPYRHVLARSRGELARAYHALDAYVVPSRQEGGPKGVLEAMAAGAPLVTTRVGQAPDLVEHGRNGFLVDVDDADAIAYAVLRLRDDRAVAGLMTAAARATAERFAYELLDPAWDELLSALVVEGGRHGSH